MSLKVPESSKRLENSRKEGCVADYLIKAGMEKAKNLDGKCGRAHWFV